jgi:hypothetical protein
VRGRTLRVFGERPPDFLPAPASKRREPRRIAIDTAENMVEPFVHYPENLPFGQDVVDDFLYLGRPARFGPARQPPALATLTTLSGSDRWQERQRAARLLAVLPAEPRVLAELDQLCADRMNVVAHTAAVSLVHLGTPAAIALAERHAARDAVVGLKREVEKARTRLRR